MKNNDIKLMDEIEKHMETEDNFYGVAVKIPFNNVICKLLDGESFSAAFKSQEELINVICAEQEYLDMHDNGKCDIFLMFQKIEKNFVKRVLRYLKYGKNFELNDLHIKCKASDLDKKIQSNFNLLKDDIDNNRSKWLMKALVYKKHNDFIFKQEEKENMEIVNKLNIGGFNLSL